MELVCKKTIDLSIEEKQAIVDLFNVVFHQERTVEILTNQYTQNAFGTCYHTLMYDGEKLVGHITGLPGFYWVNGKKLKAVNPIDLMIDEKYRGLQGFMFLVKKAWGYYKEQGVQIIFNLPNNNSHPLFIKLKCTKNIGRLYTYVLPYRIGGIVKGLSFLNFLSIIFCKAWVLISRICSSSKILDFKVQRDYNSFFSTRYKRSDGDYSLGQLNSTQFVYKLMTYEGKRTAFIIDIQEKSQQAYCEAVQYLLSHENKRFDLILYVGNLPFFNPGLIRVPHRFEPKNFNFDGAILEKGVLTTSEEIVFFDISSWDINLADDDVI